MFRIRKSQLEHFGARAQEGFEARMATYFREAFPRESSHLDLEAWIARNVRRAVERKIELEQDVAQYLLLCLRLGEDAPRERPFIDEVLRQKNLEADGKLRKIVEHLRQQKTADLDRFLTAAFQ
jgi:hypothetical protein